MSPSLHQECSLICPCPYSTGDMDLPHMSMPVFYWGYGHLNAASKLAAGLGVIIRNFPKLESSFPPGHLGKPVLRALRARYCPADRPLRGQRALRARTHCGRSAPAGSFGPRRLTTPRQNRYSVRSNAGGAVCKHLRFQRSQLLEEFCYLWHTAQSKLLRDAFLHRRERLIFLTANSTLTIAF